MHNIECSYDIYKLVWPQAEYYIKQG